MDRSALPTHDILWLRSEATGLRFPAAVFAADTDTANMGLVALTSVDRLEIVIAQCSWEEMTTPALVEARINSALARRDLRIVRLSRAVDHNGALAELTFVDFRKQYRRPTLYYNDIYSAGEAVVDKEDGMEEFVKSGGRIHLLSDA